MSDVIYLAIDITTMAALLTLTVMSFARGGYKNASNRLFAFFSLLVGLWIITNNISNDISSPKIVALYADYILFAASLGTAIILAHFILRIANSYQLNFVKRLTPIFWISVAVCFTPLIVQNIKVEGDIYAIDFGPLIWLYAIEIFYLLGMIGYGINHGLRHSTGNARRQMVVISIGLIIALPLVVLFSLVLPLATGSFEATRFGITPLIFLVISLYYAAVRYQLLDIRAAIVRTATYVLSILTLTSVYYGLAYLISSIFFAKQGNASVGINPINVGLALLLTLIFQPVKRFFDKVTNRIFYKDNYNSDEFFARLNKALAVTTDLRNLLERAAFEIGQTLKSEQVFFFIYTSNDHYMSAGTRHHRQLPKADADTLVEYYNQFGGLLLASEFDLGHPIKKVLASHRIELVMPLVRSGQMIGLLCLGDHLATGYTARDLKVLATIHDELNIAIQNATAVQEVKDLNASLQQKINNATKELRASNNILRELDKVKDEFVSMASHQLRTPLTSVKGYISMVIEGDAGKITDDQKKLLNEAFISSERMVHLINDFLNVSRLQTGKFMIDKTPVDLSVIVKQEIDSLLPNATTRGMRFIYNPPKDFPIIDLDESKMRQVIMNFADNAIFYSKDNSDIDIKLSAENGRVVFTVQDKGIGVPEEEKEHLFTKFFRASNARVRRPDGTGVGIFLAKKVIDEHGGQIIFDSTEGKGSTFGFSLPIKN